MSKSQNVAIMEVGTSKIGIFIGSRGINNTIKVVGSFEEEYSGYYNGEFVEPDKLNDDITNALTKAEINAGETIKKLFVGVPADFSILKNKTFVQINCTSFKSIYTLTFFPRSFIEGFCYWPNQLFYVIYKNILIRQYRRTLMPY